MNSLRDGILAADDFEVSDPIPCPEWGEDCVLFVRTISGEERDAFEEQSLEKKGKKREVTLKNIRARLVRLAACDANGTPVFQPGDERRLGEKSAKVLDRLFSAAQKLNGISDEDVEEMVKNSASGKNADSGLS